MIVKTLVLQLNLCSFMKRVFFFLLLHFFTAQSVLYTVHRTKFSVQSVRELGKNQEEGLFFKHSGEPGAFFAAVLVVL